jgi:Predicted membrane protein
MDIFNGSFSDVAVNICFIILGIHLVLISLFAVYQTIRDKALSNVPKDSPKYWRVPEAQLLLISALGGSVAMYLTMQTIRHKTQHPKFMIGIPAIMVAQAALVGFIVWLRLF